VELTALPKPPAKFEMAVKEERREHKRKKGRKGKGTPQIKFWVQYCRWTYDRVVADSTSGRALLSNNLGQVVHTLIVSLSLGTM